MGRHPANRYRLGRKSGCNGDPDASAYLVDVIVGDGAVVTGIDFINVPN
jgi:hypothetical protein